MMSDEQIISEINGLVINKKRFCGFSVCVYEYDDETGENIEDLLESYTCLGLEETVSRLFDLSIKGYDIAHISVQCSRPWYRRSRNMVIGDYTIRFILLKNREMKTNISSNVINALLERMKGYDI